MDPKQITLISNVLIKSGLIKEPIKEGATAHDVNTILANINPQLVKETGEIREDLTPQSNEWLATLVNKVLRILTLDQLKSIPTFEAFNRGTNINGITEMLTVNVIEGIAYSKDTTIEQFNPAEPDIEKEYLLDQFKEYYPIATSGTIIARAFTSGANFNGFLTRFIGTIVKSSSLKLYERITTAVNSYVFNLEIQVVKTDTDTTEHLNKKIIKALETYAAKIALPSTDMNENGFVSSATTKDISVFANVNYKGEMNVDVLATLYNSKKLGTFGIKHYDINFTDETEYVRVFDTDKLHYGFSVNAGTVDTIGINLKTINALHLWYGIIMLKSFSGFTIKVVETAPSIGTGITAHPVLQDTYIINKTLTGDITKGLVAYKEAMSKLQPKDIKAKVEVDVMKLLESKAQNMGITKESVDELVAAKVEALMQEQDKSVDEIVSEKVAAALAGKTEEE